MGFVLMGFVYFVMIPVLEQVRKVFLVCVHETLVSVHLHKVGLGESIVCNWAAQKQTPEHILPSQTMEIWQIGASLQDKLWGTATISNAPSCS
jgi:hypothetical protein